MSSKRPYIRFRYSEDQLKLALEEIRSEKISLNAASKKYDIPKSTLSNKTRNIVPLERKMGPSSILSKEEEQKLEDWIIAKAKLGFPMHHTEVQLAVQNIVKATGRENPFTNDKPGKKWFQLFLKRRPLLVKRNTEVISKARAAVTEDTIRSWFSDLSDFLKEEGKEDIMSDPTRIFNADETGMQFCPKTGKLLGPKSYKNFYTISSGPEKESMTVLCNFSAAGTIVPPMIIVPYKRVPRDIAMSIPDSYFLGRSDSGWMVSETFYEYVANCFFPWLKENKIPLPVILFLDGHKSHISIELYEFCIENMIYLFCLPPNATHIIQPCDVTIFKPLKTAWKRVVHEHQQATSKYITKGTFAPLFEKAFTSIKGDVIKNGFRCCGLYPLDPNAIDYEKTITFRRNEIFPNEVTSNDSQPPSLDELKATTKVLKYYFKDKCSDPSSDIYSVYQKCALEEAPIDALGDLEDDTNGEPSMVLTESLIHDLPIQFDDVLYDPMNTAFGGEYYVGQSEDMKFYTDSETIRTDFNKDDLRNEGLSMFGTNVNPNSSKDIEDQEIQDKFNPRVKHVLYEKDDYPILEIKEASGVDTDEGNVTKKNKDEEPEEDNRTNKNEVHIPDEDDITGTNAVEEVLNVNEKKIISKELDKEDFTKDKNKDNKSIEVENNESKDTNLDKCDKFDVTAVNDISEMRGSDSMTNIQLLPIINRVEDNIITLATNSKERHKNSPTENVLTNCDRDATTCDINFSNDKTSILEKTTNQCNDVSKIVILNDIKIAEPSTSSAEDIWKNVLHWPRIEETKKNKNTTRPMPFALTSKNWKNYYDEKERIKNEKLMSIKQKAEDRKRKAIDKHDIKSKRTKKQKINKQTNNEIINRKRDVREMKDQPAKKTEHFNKGEYQINDFVIVQYGKNFFPGQITDKDEDYEVSTMTKAQNGLWKWPKKTDKIWYKKEDVLKQIPVPEEVDAKGFYKINGMDNNCSE